MGKPRERGLRGDDHGNYYEYYFFGESDSISSVRKFRLWLILLSLEHQLCVRVVVMKEERFLWCETIVCILKYLHIRSRVFALDRESELSQDHWLYCDLICLASEWMKHFQKIKKYCVRTYWLKGISSHSLSEFEINLWIESDCECASWP